MCTTAQVSGIMVDKFSDIQLIQFLKANKLTNVSESELTLKAKERGLSSDQIRLLKKRIAELDIDKLSNISPGIQLEQGDPYEKRTKLFTVPPMQRIKDEDSILPVFGSELFDGIGKDFEPNISIPTPSNYILGPYDELIIDIYGISEITYNLTVNPDGFIRIPNYGPLKVGSVSLEEAKLKINSSLSKIYPEIRSGKTKLFISVGQIRSIQVNLVGEVSRPGTYALPSLSTIMHALYVSGGPNNIGSYRDIELIRNGKTIQRFDVYDYLTRGKNINNILLQDDDVIRILPYGKRVALKGAIKRQAYFDVLDTESAAKVLEYAGGLADNANKESIRIRRLGNRSREILTVAIKNLYDFDLRSGDVIEADVLSDTYKNRVKIEGAVYYPGDYSILSFPTLSSLLNHVQLKGNAFMERAVVRRMKYDMTTTIQSINLNEINQGKSDILLEKEDEIIIFDANLIREPYYVRIEGEVNKPGEYIFSEGMFVQDLILMANGLTDGASIKRVEVARRLRKEYDGKDTAIYSIVNSMDVDFTRHKTNENGWALSPFDIVYIRKAPSYKKQIDIVLEGEVMYPGKYSIEGFNERLSNLIKRAGGLKSTAFPEGAQLIRKVFQGGSKIDSTIYRIKWNLVNTKQSSMIENGRKQTEIIPENIFSDQKRVALDLPKALSNPGNVFDIFLEEGDIIKIPKIQQTVQSFGAVNYPQQLTYEDGLKFRKMIKSSGGYADNALKSRAYVLHPNGNVKSTVSFLFLRFYPRLKPGDEVYVPQKPEKQPISRMEAVGLTSGFASLAGVIFAIINSLK
jgi:protein involved in polysaccharide export with SLBB domain